MKATPKKTQKLNIVLKSKKVNLNGKNTDWKETFEIKNTYFREKKTHFSELVAVFKQLESRRKPRKQPANEVNMILPEFSVY